MKATRISVMIFAVVMVMSAVTAYAGGGRAAAAPQQVTAGSVPVQTTPIKFFTRTRPGVFDGPDNPLVLAHIEQLTGIKLDVTPIANENYAERVDLMIAANEDIDGINLVGYADSYVGLVQRNAIIPINDLLDTYGPNVKRVMADGLFTMTDSEKKIWGLPRAERFPEGYVPTIREDWLKALGMSVPTTIAEIDAYLAAVKAADLAGNGNTIPLLPNGLTYGMSNFFNYFLSAKDNNLSAGGWTNGRYMAADGTIHPIFSHPDLINLIAKFREWYSLGYMPQDIHLLQTAQIVSIRSSASFGMQAGWYNDGLAQLDNWSKANPNKPRASITALPPPRNAPGRSMWNSNPKYGPQIVFFKNGKNTVHLMRYFDWICASPENNVIANFGIENDHWSWNQDKSAVVVTASGLARYQDYYSLANTYWEEIMPKLITSQDNMVQYQMYNLIDQIKGFKASNYPFDSQVPYNVKGTDAEFLTADGNTLINETVTKMVIGQMPLSEWPRIQAQYNAIEGDILSKVWTDQYYAFMNLPRPR